MKLRVFVAGILAVLIQGLVFAGFSDGGPKPGDVYKEFVISMTSQNWRVTDPNMDTQRHPGGAAFLPNPVINFSIDDLQGATRAEVVIDFWEGHEGTTGKKFRFNGNAWINIPEPLGTKYMQQVNHLISVPLSNLSAGNNRLEGTSGPNSWDWGQWGWYGVIVRVYYGSSKPHATGQITSPASNTAFGENPVVTASTSGNVSRVDFLASYDGYDTDGDGVFTGYHRDYHRPSWNTPMGIRNHVGTDSASPFSTTWNTQWVPDQATGSIKLVARIRDANGYWYVTPEVTGLSLGRGNSSVKLYKPSGVPQLYWVRNNQTKSSKVNIATLSSATSAIMHVPTWDGNDGSDEFYSKVNSWTAPKYGANHFFSYDELPVPLSALKTGENTITFHSSTVHHGIEVIWPGPAIAVRYGTGATPPPPPDPNPDPNPDPTSNLITNGGFESGMASWNFYTSGSGNAIASGPDYEGNNSTLVTTSTDGSNIQLYQYGIRLEPNTDYVLSFAAYSSTGDDFRVSLAKHVSPYTNYGVSSARADLTSTWKTFTINFRTQNFSSIVNDGRLYFWFANDARPGDRYFIDKVTLLKGSAAPAPEPEPPPGPGPVSNVITNSGFESGMQAWKFYTNGSGSAVTSAPAYEGSNAALITTSTGGSNIQFFQHDLQLDPNTDYELSFAAYSNTGHDLRVSLIKHGSPYTDYGINNAPADLSSSYQVFTINFTTTNFSSPVSDARLYFWFANDAQPGDRFFLDQVVLIKK